MVRQSASGNVHCRWRCERWDSKQRRRMCLRYWKTMTISRLAKLCSLTFRMSVSANQMYCLHACLAYFVAVFYSFTSAEAVTCFWYCGLWFVSWSSPEVCHKNSYFELLPLTGHHASASQYALFHWPVVMTLMSLSVVSFVRLYIVKCWYLESNTRYRYACCCWRTPC